METQLSDRERAAELLWQRDEARAKCARLEAENERLKMLLRYAEEAIEGERQRADSADACTRSVDSAE